MICFGGLRRTLDITTEARTNESKRGAGGSTPAWGNRCVCERGVFAMSSKDRSDKESSRNLAADYDRTDGSKFDHYGRESVTAANHATEGADHE